jgi:hypothetical protein
MKPKDKTMKQTLWIAREDKHKDWYKVYADEPKKLKKRGSVYNMWPIIRLVMGIHIDQVNKYLPFLKLRPGEKKPFTITE